MRTLGIAVAALALTACSTTYWDRNAYWDRPGATLPVLAHESGSCYQAALDPDTPSAFPGSGPANPVLPRTQPPPKLWERAPRDAGFERFDEQARYERCMRVLGWRPARVTTPTY
jgi:hypothetical protein